jgi:hypothetical protein
MEFPQCAQIGGLWVTSPANPRGRTQSEETPSAVRRVLPGLLALQLRRNVLLNDAVDLTLVAMLTHGARLAQYVQ